MQDEHNDSVVSGVVIEPFNPGWHDRSRFDCGTDRLDNFLRFSARKRQKDDFTRIFVAVAKGSLRIIGYYALNAHAIATSNLGLDRPWRSPQYRKYSGTVSLHDCRGPRLAGQRPGSDLAVDAFGRARNVTDEVGIKLVGLDVINDGGQETFARRMTFYRRLGFRNFQDCPERMFIAMNTIRAMFDDG